jgi:hypothetical protein
MERLRLCWVTRARFGLAVTPVTHTARGTAGLGILSGHGLRRDVRPVGAENSVTSLTRRVCTTRAERTDAGESSEACDRICAVAAQWTYAVVRPILGAEAPGPVFDSGHGVRRGIWNSRTSPPAHLFFRAVLPRVSGPASV